MSQANRLNICVIPGGRGQVRNFHFRPVTLTVFTVMALAALIFLSFYSFHSYWTRGRFVDRSREVATLKAANTDLEAQAGTFASALGALEERILRLSELGAERSALTAEIRIQLGLPQEATDDEVLPRLAAAAVWAESSGLGGPKNRGSGSRDMIRGLNQELERLMALADRAELDMTTINESLSGGASILAATPTILPISSSISSRFGRRLSPFAEPSSDFHRGLDIPAPPGTPVRAPADGTVLASGHFGGYGLLMTIDHGYGLITRYGHLDSVLIEVGQTVHRGQTVALSGNSGRTTGPHLHYEVLLGGVPADPLEILAAVRPALFREVKLEGTGGRDAYPVGGMGGP